MSIEFLAPVVAGLAAIAANVLTHYLKRKLSPAKTKTYGERLKELVTQLSHATSNVDEILSEVAAVAKDREDAINKLETELRDLEGKEKAMKEKIELLAKTPLPVAQHFAELMRSTEKTNAKRDYMLFGAGVVVSTVIAIALKLLGWG